MAIYKWPNATIQEGERIIRNFLWSGDPDKQKFVTIKWNKVYKHPSEGGIGIHGLRDINLSMLMKLGWGFLNIHDPWETFLRAKFLTREGLLIPYNKHSSIGNGLKEAIAAIWDWLASLFHIQGTFLNLKQTLDSCSQKSAYISDLWKAAVLNFIYFLWRSRNDIIFEGIPSCLTDLKCKILAAVKEVADLSVNSMSNNSFELVIVIALGIPVKARPLPRVQRCTWALPWFQEVKINVGVVAMGSPGTAGTGAIVKNHNGEVIGVLSHGVGIKTLFYTECEAVIGALFWAVKRSWNYIWIEADFQSTISRNQVPWHHRARWNKIEKSFLTLILSLLERGKFFSNPSCKEKQISPCRLCRKIP
ncbi:hypothetical protein GIB67_003313 [Kingdonia uniflora]|uniref:RNase H type-1 domain-containing protein n=1 Tax=Kingdonia uniflora TaxID=39325 RepID=A0A7J7P8P0_9MAGN|nr:hypothetical protein GIB67_003313 [Kingdonia uniflora]